MQALYNCEVCNREWEEHLPPLWTFMDVWPKCCGIDAFLVDTLDALSEWPTWAFGRLGL